MLIQAQGSTLPFRGGCNPRTLHSSQGGGREEGNKNYLDYCTKNQAIVS
jgi:hypothetical protein